MQSALIVHSKSTKGYAEVLAKEYKEVEFLEVRSCTEDLLEFKHDKDLVIGIGGGGVIDAAKIISGCERCIAIPTTASGAAMTSHSVVWGKEKISISVKKPILEMPLHMSISLPRNVLQSTIFDAVSQAIEADWSRNSTPESKLLSKMAFFLIEEYFKTDSIRTLIVAGNLAGCAIEITGTNVIHATSYPITIKYGISHGTACGMVLLPFVEFMGYDLSEFILSNLKGFAFPEIVDFDTDMVVEETMKYDKFNDGPKKVSKEDFKKILGG